MKTFFLRLLIIMTFQTFISVSYARDTGYEVELIIFEDAKGRYLNSEDWDYNDMLNNKKNQKIKAIKVKPDPEYKQLNWAGSKLTGNLEKLKNNANYRVLITKRWKQTGLDRKHAFNIPISSIITEATISESKKLESTTIPAVIEPYLKGNVKLIMSRYLHFNVDLEYVIPQSDNNGEIKNMLLPVVNERRMRSKEIHYIDHPLVGIVVLATPYKIESETNKTDTTEYKTM